MSGCNSPMAGSFTDNNLPYVQSALIASTSYRTFVMNDGVTGTSKTIGFAYMPPSASFLDPLCGVAGLAVCLKGRKIEAPKATLMALVRHDGEGSSIGDLQQACTYFGLEGRVVTAQDDQGLMMLPKPLVAHVERDHFVAVTRADKAGVSYVCSDCGPWPGGEVRLSWKQWHAMEADQLLVMSRPGSAEALALSNLPTHPGEKAHAISLASLNTTDLGVVTAAARALSAMNLHVVGQGTAFLPLLGVICGERGQSLQCSCPIACPVSSGGPGSGSPGSGSGSGGAGGGSSDMRHGVDGGGGRSGGGSNMHAWGGSHGDPVNLATGEEEYESNPDLTVYNPTGPSVVWSRSYDSLANTTPNGFGAGWSHPYNIRIEDNSLGGVYFSGTSTNVATTGASPNGVVGPAQGSSTSYIVLPNTAKISFTPDPNNPPTASSPVKHLTVQAGFPYLVDWYYDSATGGKYFQVTLENRTKWIFQDCNVTTSHMGLEYVKQIQDRVGNSINLSWATFTYNTPDPDTLGFTEPGLTSITDSSGTALLTVNYGTNGRITSVCDRYGRSVYYSVSSHSTSNVTCDDLDQVSQIVPTGTSSPSVLYQFTYVNSGNQDPNGSEQVPYLPPSRFRRRRGPECPPRRSTTTPPVS